MPTRFVRADLHNHLRTSSRRHTGDFNRAVDVASRRLGAGGILGLINFSDTRYETFVATPGYERAHVGEQRNAVHIPHRDILVVKGQEIPTQHGHVLVMGLGHGTHLKEGRTVEDTLKEAHDFNGIIIADHPCYVAGIGQYLREHPNLIEQFDGVETHNSEADLWLPRVTPRHANREAGRLYNDLTDDLLGSVGEIATSDGHSWYEVGKSWTGLEMPTNYSAWKNSENFLAMLRRAVWAQRYSKEIIPKELNGTPKQFQRMSGRLGCLDHIVDLAFIVHVAPRIGVKKRFETERPQ